MLSLILAALFFIGIHLGIAGTVIRDRAIEILGENGISQEILTQTGTTRTFNIPTSWPTGPAGARYDLVFVFDRPSGNGPMTGFTLLAQQLLAGDLP